MGDIRILGYRLPYRIAARTAGPCALWLVVLVAAGRAQQYAPQATTDADSYGSTVCEPIQRLPPSGIVESPPPQPPGSASGQLPYAAPAASPVDPTQPPPAPSLGTLPPPGDLSRPAMKGPDLLSPSDGFGGMGRLGGFGPGANLGCVDYKVLWMPNEPVSGQPTNFAMVGQDFSVKVPIWSNGPDGLSFSTSVRWELFDTDAVLPNSGWPFPKDLWDVVFGGSYRHRFDNGWI